MTFSAIVPEAEKKGGKLDSFSRKRGGEKEGRETRIPARGKCLKDGSSIAAHRRTKRGEGEEKRRGLSLLHVTRHKEKKKKGVTADEDA